MCVWYWVSFFGYGFKKIGLRKTILVVVLK